MGEQKTGETPLSKRLKQHSTSVTPILKLLPIMSTQFASRTFVTPAHTVLSSNLCVCAPQGSYPINNESAKEMKESELMNLRANAYVCASVSVIFVNSNTSHKFEKITDTEH